MLRLFGDRDTLIEALTMDWADHQLQLPRRASQDRSARRRRFRTSRRVR
ncbi:hypothetical protein ACLM45_01635 [Synechococcus sp. A10-1-5-9]|jgi:hypothetical protein|nr:hypothetical protein [Synechococcus sp. WH 7805]